MSSSTYRTTSTSALNPTLPPRTFTTRERGVPSMAPANKSSDRERVRSGHRSSYELTLQLCFHPATAAVALACPGNIYHHS